MHPSIIVKSDLSSETIEHPERSGFLPAAFKPLLDLRITPQTAEENESSVRWY